MSILYRGIQRPAGKKAISFTSADACGYGATCVYFFRNIWNSGELLFLSEEKIKRGCHLALAPRQPSTRKSFPLVDK